jgi:GTP-binding protein HflX
MDTLLAKLGEMFGEKMTTTLHLIVPAADGKRIAWLYSHGTVLSQTEKDGELHIEAKLTHENKARWEKMVGS